MTQAFPPEPPSPSGSGPGFQPPGQPGYDGQLPQQLDAFFQQQTYPTQPVPPQPQMLPPQYPGQYPQPPKKQRNTLLLVLVPIAGVLAVLMAGLAVIYFSFSINSIDASFGELTPSGGSYAVALGDEIPITTTTDPENTFLDTIHWESSDRAVVEISTDGKMLYAKSLGTATVTATSTFKHATRSFIFDVVIPIEEFGGLPESLTLGIGETYALQPVFSPADATETLKFTSSDPIVATVDETGLITANATGNAQITAFSAKLAHSIAVRVSMDVTRIDLGDNITMNFGETHQLDPLIEPAGALNQQITYTSSAPDIVRVSADGILTPLYRNAEESSVEITAAAENGVADTVRVTVYNPYTWKWAAEQESKIAGTMYSATPAVFETTIPGLTGFTYSRTVDSVSPDSYEEQLYSVPWAVYIYIAGDGWKKASTFHLNEDGEGTAYVSFPAADVSKIVCIPDESISGSFSWKSTESISELTFD
ncbi:MAG: Ig-like domain-containing protein [Propionibacteriaceae bacterium]|jgi:hypothetical protein|nr:Ig-like domain-containing protein [Propionibacteriaceae bacterium]